jgi:N-acetylglucosamine-6-sulfatase
MNILWRLVSIAALAAAVQQQPLNFKEKPNIVFILTDDQDLELGSLDYMPLLQKYIVQEGTTYKRHYCSTAICCPSRVTLWTGKNAHNTNVTDVFPPYGKLSIA